MTEPAFNTKSVQGKVYRSIPYIAHTQALFDDLGDEVDQQVAISVEAASKPGPASAGSPVLCRPFDQAEWYSLIGYPFESIGQSRLSAGSYGVWYGALEWETAVRETLHYATNGFLADRLDGRVPSKIERRVYGIDIERLLVDMSRPATLAAKFSDPNDHSYAQAAAAKLRALGMPGIFYKSARCTGGNVGLFSPDGLSNPQHLFHVTFEWADRSIIACRNGVEIFRQPQ